MARTFRDPDARIVLSHMAEGWLRLADNLDGDQVISPPKVVDESQPVIQQQQQIQPKDEHT
jgi:hypothetical protein